MIDRSRIEIKLGSYGTAPADALADRGLHLRAQEHRRYLSGHMTALDQEGLRKKLPEAEYLVSRKIDGEFTVAASDGTDAVSVNPGGTVRVGLPCLAELAELTAKAGLHYLELAGELYVERSDRRTRVHDVLRHTRKPETAEDIESLRFAAFDILRIDGGVPTGGYAAIYRRIEEILAGGTLVHPVETVKAAGVADVASLYAKWVESEGGEGVVARSDVAGIFKIKRRHTLDVVVIGFRESDEEDRVGMVHDVLVATVRPDGTFQILGRVGGGFTDEERHQIVSDLKDIPADSDYIAADEGVAYAMARPEYVIEVSILDLLTENTRGAPINQMVLQWKDEQYTALRLMPLCSMISPQFVRMRPDKRAGYADAPIRQVTTIVEIADTDRRAEEIALPASTLLRREVFTKELKGQTMVRKFLLWETNKANVSEDYAAYVLHYTDFSPGRKSPLDRTLRVSSSWDQIEELYEQFKTEYVVKGWHPAESAEEVR